MPPNRLAAETSPYLRQHAGNPVDWYPWGPDALAAAREREVPIFLSVGYSACHWCHVMERECFASESIAAVMNAHFVNVKVDREERPDLDQIYMAAHQALNRGEGGGWPLSVFLTPAGEPFYAGTYFPPDERYAPDRPGFPRLLRGVAAAWAGDQRANLLEVGGSVAAFLRDRTADAPPGAAVPGPEALSGAAAGLKRVYDATHGGFGPAPKFPHAVDLRLLFRVAARFDKPDVAAVALHTLERMARGGLCDQVGGGFHRYSTDAEWLVPHFEKMLYDNALLPPAYVDAFLVTGEESYRHVATRTLDYALRELLSPDGGFFSTQDADSEGEEGKFNLWTRDELEAAAGPELADLAAQTFGATAAGNFDGRNVLFRPHTDAEDAARHGLSVGEFRAKLDQVRCKLYGARSRRVWPERDEKILTAWNGLMIGALAHAGAALGEERFTAAAARAAGFVLDRLRAPDGRLFRTCGVDHPAKLAGYLDDYATLADGLVTLYEAAFDPEHLRAAVDLADAMLAHFADPAGGFFYTPADGEALIARPKDPHDNATPAAGSVAVLSLLRLAALTGRADFRRAAEAGLRAGAALLADSPLAAGQLLTALDFFHGPVDEIAVIGAADDPDTARALAAVRRQYRPNRVVAFHDPASGSPPACALLDGKPAADGEVTVYVCRDFACRAPVVGAAAVEAAFAG